MEAHTELAANRSHEGLQSFEAPRLQMIDEIDRLLDVLGGHPDEVVALEAPVVGLEDYLEIRPHRRSEIEQYIREGRLQAGPWYVRNDFNLCSGEASIRNLLIGSTLFRGLNKPQVGGNLRMDAPDSVLHGTLSSCPYLKLLNMHCQNLLELVLEPLYAQLCQWTGGAVEYPSDMLEYLWKELLRNHDRDSIRGCSSDRVLQDNENRFLRIVDATEELWRLGLNHLVHRIDRRGMDVDGYLLTIVNPLPYERAEYVVAALHPLVADGLQAFGLLDEQGNPVEFDRLDPSELNFCLSASGGALDENRVHRHHIRFRMVVPPCGFRTVRLFRTISDSDAGTIMRPAPQGWVMQNEYMRVVVGADGQVDLLDSETGIESPDLLGFEDLADAGNACSFAFDPNAQVMDCNTKPVVSILGNRGVRLEYDFGVTLDLSLDAGCRHLAIDAKIDNRQRNHRLRLLVRTDVHNEESISSQPFGCIRHGRGQEPRTDWTEPNNGLVSVKDWNKQISIFNNGIYEYEHLRDSRGTIALTLMRSTGGIGPGTIQDAPESQCLSVVTCRLAIRPGQAGEAVLLQEMQCFQVPMLTVFDAVDSRKFSGGLPYVGDPDLQENLYRLPKDKDRMLPASRCGITVGENVVFSTLKRSNDRDAWILRFYNPSDEPVNVLQPELTAEISELDERVGGLPWRAGATVGAKKIITLRY